MSSDTENDLFGDEAAGSPSTSQIGAAPSPQAANNADPHDLFGDDDNEAPKPARSSSNTPASSPQATSPPNPLEYAESDDEAGDVDVEEQWATLPCPTWPRLRPTDGKVWLLKLPVYVNIEQNPFEPDFYRRNLEAGSDELHGNEAKGHMIKVRNTMRWRWVTGFDGRPTKQANSRLLRWSDGSVSLQLGGEMFDVAPSQGSTLARPSDPKGKDGASKSGSHENNFVCYAAGGEQVLLAETALEGQLNIVPTSMDSKTHRELVKHVGQQHVKHSRIKVLEDETHGDRLKDLLARAGPQRAAPVKKTTRRAPSGGVRAAGGFGRRGAFGRATKRADSEESEIEDTSNRRAAGGGYDEDDGFVVADSDDSDDEYKNKKKKRRVDEEDMDATELAEARIEAREKRERKRAKTKRSRAYSDDEDDDEDAAGEPAEDEEDEDDAEIEMDVESEEE